MQPQGMVRTSILFFTRVAERSTFGYDCSSSHFSQALFRGPTRISSQIGNWTKYQLTSLAGIQSREGRLGESYCIQYSRQVREDSGCGM